MENQKYILSVLAILLTCSSCDKKMEKMNTNPLALSEIPDEYLFTSAIRQTFGGSAAYVMRFPCQYAHIYVTNNENRAADGYLDFHSQDVYKEMFQNLLFLHFRH